jgi:hypothetical protein
MLKGYADEHVVFGLIQALRQRGMDVVRVQDRGREEEQWHKHLCPGSPPWVPEDQACPCEGLKARGVTWSDALPTTACELREQGVFLAGAAGDLLLVSTTTDACGIIASGQSVLSLDVLSPEAFEACNASLRRIAANDGVTCVP